MFWQGGGKKRMKQMLEGRLQPVREHSNLASLPLARKDDDLLRLYYFRDELRDEASIMWNSEVNFERNYRPQK